MDFLLGLFGDLAKYIGILTSILSGLITICMFIPGVEPEQTLQKLVDFLSKYSKK